MGMELVKLEVQVTQSAQIRFFSQANISCINFYRSGDKYERPVNGGGLTKLKASFTLNLDQIDRQHWPDYLRPSNHP